MSRQIYRFVSRNEASRQFLKPRAQLQFHGGRDSDSEDDGVPACPYTCRMCDRDFRHVSSLMQHMVSTVQWGIQIQRLLLSAK